jgi:hypothetical protein
MVDETTIEVSIDKETENYAVYESADGESVVGFYVAEGAAEQVGQFATLTVGAEDGIEATKKKDTASYGVFEAQPTVTGMYVSHDVLGSEESEEDGPTAPETTSILLDASDEDSFEEAEQAAAQDEEQEAALVGESQDSDEEESETDEEEAEIPDEEIGLVGDEA